ncbi:MAG: transposase, partial [Candidatus Paracaedibacteraceae bacterium]|nr:transposase [Candidatus Paracaedibacteraceae bacterium]
MQRRQWTSEKKTLIVLSGLKGQSVASICNEHGISQSQYYQWKDQ